MFLSALVYLCPLPSHVLILLVYNHFITTIKFHLSIISVFQHILDFSVLLTFVHVLFALVLFDLSLITSFRSNVCLSILLHLSLSIPVIPLGDHLGLLDNHLVTTWWPLGDHLVTTWWPISEILTLFVLCLFLVNMQFSPLRYWRSSASLLLTAVKWHQRQLLKIHIQPVRNNPELLVIFLRERAVKKKYGKCASSVPLTPHPSYVCQ